MILELYILLFDVYLLPLLGMEPFIEHYPSTQKIVLSWIVGTSRNNVFRFHVQEQK